MRELMKKLGACLTAGKSAVMVTVVAASGSTPRGAGARMLVSAEGRLCGTIGGGAVEHKAEAVAGGLLDEGKNALREFSLSGEENEGLGMVCGGAVTLSFQYFKGGDCAAAALAERIAGLLDEGGQAWLVLTLTGREQGRSELVFPGDDPVRCADLAALPKECALFQDADGQTCYAELLRRAGTVYIFGGGHVAQELVPLLAHNDFRCVLLDDRAQFADKDLFPDAHRILLTEFDQALRQIRPTAADYAVVMTRGHQYDLTVQKQLLATDVGYLGVMGSRQKKEHVFRQLRESGFTERDLARVITPIGLPIGAETPAEIAVSIAAQLIQTRAARRRAE